MGWLVWLGVFILTFCFMELAAWLLHKYVMHGFLWSLHEDHHIYNKDQVWEKNDCFAFFFAVPSFLLILIDSFRGIPLLGAIGFGIMGYGVVYFLVHEVIIHRRLVLFGRINHWYIQAINSAHKVHHSIQGKKNSSNLGMLFVSWSYLKNSWKKRN
jgi:beta-carotene 3-hydroxylase